MSLSGSKLKLNNGHEVPVIGLGTWKSSPGEVKEAVIQALKAGYRHIDCAAGYGNEKEVGEAIKEVNLPREQVFVTSKLWNTKHHPDDVEASCRASLADLGLSYLDLYLIHWPIAFERGGPSFPKNEDGTVRYDFNIPITDTWKAMEKLVEKGLAKSIGLSNFNSEQIGRILAAASIKPVMNQVECHPYLGQAKLLKFCKERDILLTAYSPLGSPDRPWAKPDDPKLLDDPKLKEVAAKYGKSVAQIIIKWQVQRGIVVIPKSVTPSRIVENGNVFDFSLSDEDMKQVDAFECNGRVVLPMLNGKPRDGSHPDFPFHIEF